MRPGYGQKAFPDEGRRGRLRLLASRGGDEGSLVIHQDARLYDARLSPGQEVTHALGEGRHAWLQVVRGSVLLNGTRLGEGDGAAVSDESNSASAPPPTPKSSCSISGERPWQLAART